MALSFRFASERRHSRSFATATCGRCKSDTALWQRIVGPQRSARRASLAGSSPRECSSRGGTDGSSAHGGWKRRSRGQSISDTSRPYAKAAYLHDVDVEPRLQRSGVGRQLIERAKDVARGWPVGAIRLDAYDGHSGGGPFYGKCGFTEVGRAVYRGVPLVYFEFVLRINNRSIRGATVRNLLRGHERRIVQKR